VILRAAVLAFVLVVVVGCGQQDVDRGRAVAENARLLETFPVPPDSTRISTDSRPLEINEDPLGGEYIASYATYASYRTPVGTTLKNVARFYARDLVGWRRQSSGASSSGTKTICYQGATASACVRLLSNLDPGTDFGTVFQVSVADAAPPE
jgi:hypothetical protein